MVSVDLAGPVCEISRYLLIPCKFFDMFIWEGRAGSVLEVSVFLTGNSVSSCKRAGKFFLINPLARLPWWKRDEFCIVLLLLLYFPHHNYSIWQRWHSYKSCQSYNRRESYNFVFRHVGCVSRISRRNSSSAFSHLENRAEISHTNPR